MPGIRKLTVGGQWRLRYENRVNYDFKDNAGATNDFFGQRARLNLGFEFNDDITAFFQFQDIRNWGEELSTVDDSADGFDLQQGWVQVKDLPGIGGTTRVGRQVLSLGSQRIIGGLDWLNQGRRFDGALQSYTWNEKDALNLFFVQLREIINQDNDDALLVGGFGTVYPTEDSLVDVYAIHLNQAATGAGMITNRTTFGLRYVQKISDGLKFETELATQTGEQNGADIPIGETFAGVASLRFAPDVERKPWVMLEVNVASGDDPNTADNERFNSLFPTLHKYWGMMDFADWANLTHGMAQVGAKVSDSGSLSASWHIFRAMEEGDRFGGPTATLSNGAAAGSSKDMGQELDFLYKHTFPTERVKTSLQVGYGVFLPGSGVQDALSTDDVAHFLYVMNDFRF